MRTAVAAAVLTILLAAPASAQTPPTPRPPDAFLGSATGEVKAEIQFYCWREPDGAGGTIGICADNFNPIDPPQAVVVNQGDVLTLRFDRPIRPDSVSVSRRESSTSAPIETFNVPADNPTRFRANFPTGTHIVTMFTTWPQGDAMYVFEVTVRPAPADPGVLPPGFLDVIAGLTGHVQQRLAEVLAATAALTAAVSEVVDALLGGRAGAFGPLPTG